MNDYLITNCCICALGGGLSDYRIKTDINSFSLHPCDVMKLRPVSFCFGKNPGRRRYGFIAQEVCEVFPQIICCNQLHRYYEGKETVDPTCSKGEPLLEFDMDPIYVSYTGVIKDLKTKVENLRRQINELKAV